MFRKLKPEKVYVTDDVYKDHRAAACVDRLMTAIEGAAAERVSYTELDEIALNRWQNVPRWGSNRDPRDPDMVMTMGKFYTEEEQNKFKERYPNLGIRDLWGFTTKLWRRDGEPDFRKITKGCICHSAWQLHSVCGCPFRCSYCSFGGVNRIFVNMEEYVEHLDDLCKLKPFQRLYKWDNQTDVSCFEPEWGAARLLVEYFARKPGKYLEIYTGKSDNIDDLLSLDHKGKTILQWSIVARTQSTVIEKETAPWDRRIEAARKCQEAGYIVRFRFSPIVPVKNWKEENAELIDLIFAKTKPDVISLCAFGWMSLEDAKASFDFSLLDPQYVAAMESAAPFLAARGFTGGGGRPIPHDARAYMFKFLIDEIRKHSKTVPISLCLETVEMWALFARELGMPVNPEKHSTYYCNCGPMCTPESPYSKGVTPGPSWFGDPNQ
ncbi:MAG: radical SAM protein [Kiritimatiellae bacterium]|nr:radical SAM protein [Kiritimatiellia bacterium]